MGLHHRHLADSTFNNESLLGAPSNVGWLGTPRPNPFLIWSGIVIVVAAIVLASAIH